MKRRHAVPTVILLAGLLAALTLPCGAAAATAGSGSAKVVPRGRVPVKTRVAGDVPAVALDVAAFIASHPTAIVCDADVNLGPNPPPQGVEAWTVRGTGPIHLRPERCDDLGQPVGSARFGRAIGTLIHEASHARGVRREACAEMTADIGVFDVLARFYRVPMFTPLSWQVGAQVLALTRGLPADYQPELCWRSAYG